MKCMKSNKGVTAVEYGLIGALISVVIMGAVTVTGINTKEVFCVIASDLEKALGRSGSDCAMSSGNSNDSGKSGNSDSDSSSSDGSGGSGSGGAGDAGSGSDGSGGTSTPEGVEFTLSDGGSLTELKDNLVDTLNQSYIDKSYGGGAVYSDDYWPVWDRGNAEFNNTLTTINASDPITNIFGLYSYPSGDVVGSLSDYENLPSSSYLSPAMINGKEQNTGFEITTQSGKVYQISTDGTYKEANAVTE